MSKRSKIDISRGSSTNHEINVCDTLRLVKRDVAGYYKLGSRNS